MAGMKYTASQWSVAPVTMAKIASTGMLSRNSMPFDSTRRATQMVRGMVVERTSFASRVKATVASDTAPVNHIQGRSPVRRKTM